MAKRATKKKGKRLVIVESPAKARTLAGILGSEYDIRSSVGHVRDLPKTRLGVDPDEGFQPRYVVPKDKKDVVKELKGAAEKASEIFLATDPDREGEAISWHLVEAADLQERPHQRVVFHEITPEAVREAFEHPRPIDQHLVDAQQARRVLDRLVGYKISPILWKKIRRGLSAGRVQSVALRMIVEREREIQKFEPQEYWTIDADLMKEGEAGRFTARLVGEDGSKKKIEIGNKEEADRLVSMLREAAYTVADVKKRPTTRRPAAPFTTSTLQQEASRRLGFTARRTMAVAQQLYEGLELAGQGQVGLITYMRTDSTNIATSAQDEARAYITRRFGGDFVPSSPRVYKTKSKGAQEAHEAIRPTSVPREPGSMRGALSRDQLRLYTLIWQRFVACQMADATFDQTTVEVDAAAKDGVLRLRATESVVRFPGFRQLYEETREESDVAADEPQARDIPELNQGDALVLAQLSAAATDGAEKPPEPVRADQHFTEPPPRYTEASLVKTLEEYGIGRPSTYASIISTLKQREYVTLEKRRFRPTDVGRVVNKFLTEHFTPYVDYEFTARMEDALDEISRGEKDWIELMEGFWTRFKNQVESKAETVKRSDVTQEKLDEDCPRCGRRLAVRLGRRGRFIGCTGYPDCDYTRSLDGSDEGGSQAEAVQGRTCPKCGSALQVKTGRYGKFIGCSGYPNCNFVEPLVKPVDMGIRCPECGEGNIMKRRSRRGKVFYSCGTYPKCTYAVWNQPVDEPCPRCGWPILTLKTTKRRGTEKVCPQKECRHAETVEEPERVAS